MKQLVAGKTGPLKVSSAKAVHALMHKRVDEGTIERPDISAPSGVVRVNVRVGDKVAAFLQQRKKSPVMG